MTSCAAQRSVERVRLLFTDWRGQAALSALFAAVAVYVLIILLDEGLPGFAGVIVAVNAVSALNYAYGAVIARREVAQQRQQGVDPGTS